MTITNRQRLDNLRAEIIGTFRGVGKDIQHLLARQESDWDTRNIAIDSYHDSNGETAVAMNIPHNPNKDRELARTLRDQYSYAFSICNSAHRLMEDGVTIADRLIAKWGGAQMLVAFPELIDDETPDLQADIESMLKRVQGRLEIFKAPRKVENQDKMAEFFDSVKGMGLDDVMQTRLDAAEDILYEVEKTAKAMLFER